MNVKRVLIPVFMIVLSAAALFTYKHLVVPVPALPLTSSPANPASPSPTTVPTSGPTTAPTSPQQAPIPAVGDPSPEFSLPSVQGGAVSLSDYRGNKNAVLLFYSTGG